MSRDAITKLEQERQKKQIKQTLEEASWDIPKLLKINARLVKEKHELQAELAQFKSESGFGTLLAENRATIEQQAEQFSH